jgi:hypothetical protein
MVQGLEAGPPTTMLVLLLQGLAWMLLRWQCARGGCSTACWHDCC